MTSTLSTIPDSELRPLDLTPIFQARATALALAARLEQGDRTAIMPARELLDAVDARQSLADAALRSAGITDVRSLDSVNELVCGLGFGHLQLWVDVIDGREAHPDAPDTEMPRELGQSAGNPITDDDAALARHMAKHARSPQVRAAMREYIEASQGMTTSHGPASEPSGASGYGR